MHRYHFKNQKWGKGLYQMATWRKRRGSKTKKKKNSNLRSKHQEVWRTYQYCITDYKGRVNQCIKPWQVRSFPFGAHFSGASPTPSKNILLLLHVSPFITQASLWTRVRQSGWPGWNVRAGSLVNQTPASSPLPWGSQWADWELGRESMCQGQIIESFRVLCLNICCWQHFLLLLILSFQLHSLPQLWSTISFNR